MRLPDGVSYHPRETDLIGKGGPALLRIDDRAYPSNTAYQVKDRAFDVAIAPYLRGDWKEFDELYRLSRPSVVYSGAQHEVHPKLPNITVVPNLTVEKPEDPVARFIVFGCTMGHFHVTEESDARVQEVYEFQSHGMLVIDRRNGEPELWVARAGDKVAVPNACHMTLYNLGDISEPLVTLDFADWTRNRANKELVEQWGPILLAYYDDREVVLRLNRFYINHAAAPAGVGLNTLSGAELDVDVRISRDGRLPLGALLHHELTRNAGVIGRLARLGLRVMRASPEAVLEPWPEAGRAQSRLHFVAPLVEATRGATDVYRYFFRVAEPLVPGALRGPGIEAANAARTVTKEKSIRLRKLNRPLQIVVEGAGDWVTTAYRSIFRQAQGRQGDGSSCLSVYYADDTLWKARPEWASQLEPWETYLDKSDPVQARRYRNLRPDVVFVVTPDFTHSTIARQWIGRTPLVFVEKPFDTHVANVDALFAEAGQNMKTAILGLDHWQVYALPMHTSSSAIVQHLGGALKNVVFYMAEDRPIEVGRERSLQHGLTLDLLPHLVALLTYFGDVGTIDQISVGWAGQYVPLVAEAPGASVSRDIPKWFRNETASCVQFTFRDASGTGYPVRCRAVSGKGFARGVRYLEANGVSGDAIRVDLNRRPDPDPAPDYPWDSLFFLVGDEPLRSHGLSVREVADPYDRTRRLRILEDPNDSQRFRRPVERNRYQRLLDDLLDGTRDSVSATLLPREARGIVQALDRIWRAVQGVRPWAPYALGRIAPHEVGVPLSDSASSRPACT